MGQTFKPVVRVVYTTGRSMTASWSFHSATNPFTNSASTYKTDLRVCEPCARRSWPVPHHPSLTLICAFHGFGWISSRVGGSVAAFASAKSFRPLTGRKTCWPLAPVKIMHSIFRNSDASCRCPASESYFTIKYEL